MRILVTGSSGHLGEALVRVLRAVGDDVVGLDLLPSPWTDVVAPVGDRGAVRDALAGAGAVVHTATLHEPHVGTHDRQAFVDTDVTGTPTVLEEAVAAGVGRVVVTSTTSAFGRALTPAPGEPAAWVTEDVAPRVRDVYGATEVAAEDLCELVARDTGLPVVVLRTSRFLPDAPAVYQRLGGRLLPTIDRVYVDDAARADLGRTPEWDFRRALDRAAAGLPPRSDLATTVGAKGHHAEATGPYTVR